MDKIIIEKYKSGLSLREIAKEFKVDPKTVSYWLKKYNCKIRGRSASKRKSPLNENYFEKIDSHEKAYFLGLLFADGCLVKIKNSFRIKLALGEKDDELTKAFSKAIYFGVDNTYISKTKNENWQDLSCIAASSKKMGDDLINLGCFPNKSSKIVFDSKKLGGGIFANSFLLGFFDGDGCASGKVAVFTSNEIFCLQIQDFLENKGIKTNKLSKGSNGYGSLRISGKENLSKLYNLLYSDFWHPLKRKQEKFLMLSLTGKIS